MVDTDLTVEAGETRTVASGEVDNGDPVVVAGELVVAGEVQVKPDYQPLAAGASGAEGGALTTIGRIIAASGAGGADGDATTQRARALTASGASGANGDTLTQRTRFATASGASGADGGVVTVEIVVPLIRRDTRTQSWNEQDDLTLDAESDQ